MMNHIPSSSPSVHDEEVLRSICMDGDRPHLASWIHSSQEYRASLEGGDTTDPVLEAKIIFAKQVHTALEDILEEREKRLAEKCGTIPGWATTEQRFDSPFYTHITIDQVVKYLDGDRTDAVFAIEPPFVYKQGML